MLNAAAAEFFRKEIQKAAVKELWSKEKKKEKKKERMESTQIRQTDKQRERPSAKVAVSEIGESDRVTVAASQRVGEILLALPSPSPALLLLSVDL